MGRKKTFTLNVVNQDGVVYYGQCELLFVPSEKDTVAVMAYHTPMIMKLGSGKVAMRDGHNMNVLTSIKSGVLYVGENEVSVLAN